MTIKNDVRIERRNTPGGTLALLSVVKGLVSNEEILEQALNEEKPDILALPMPPEGLKDLKRWKGDIGELPLTDEDMLYIRGLESFGEARLPPPCYISAIRLCEKRSIRLEAVDMDEDMFSNFFCDNVSIFDLWRRTRTSQRMQKRWIDASTPEEYADTWESLLLRNKGLAAVEKERERYIAEAIIRLSSHGKTLAIIEHERRKGILENIDSILKEKQ